MTEPNGSGDAVWRACGDPLLAATGHGALDGESVAVKDLYAVAGYSIGAGIPEFASGQPAQVADAAAVAALRAAGAQIRGIAQTDQFAYSLAGQNAAYGTPVNVAAPECVPGGSTSGPSVAVSLGQASIGLGTDTAGSIRVPSSYQRLWGIRTTHGLVSKAGLLELAPSFDTVGWVTRDVALLRRVAEVLVPPANRAPLHVGAVIVCPALTGLADPVIARRVAEAASRLAEALDVQLNEWPLQAGVLDEWFTAFRTVQAHEAWQVHGEWITAHPGVLGDDVAGRFAAAARVTGEECASARATVAVARDAIRAVIDGTVLVMPAASSAPPRLDSSAAEVDAVRSATLHLTCVAGLGGLPVVSAPVGTRLEPGGQDSQPGNVAFVAAPRSDVELCELAARLA